MRLVQIGRRWINLDSLILVEQSDGSTETSGIPQGGMRVTLLSGKEFDLPPSESHQLTHYLDDVAGASSTDRPLRTVTGFTELVRDSTGGIRSRSSKEPG